jgi:pyrimidine operon attenuation protein/uracil phosphoribosyltransferase
MDYGRPASVELAVLIDRRGCRQFPIHPDYAGQAVDTGSRDHIRVCFAEVEGDGPDSVYLDKGDDSPS